MDLNIVVINVTKFGSPVKNLEIKWLLSCRLSKGKVVLVLKLFNFSYISGTNSAIVYLNILNKLLNLVDETTSKNHNLTTSLSIF